MSEELQTSEENISEEEKQPPKKRMRKIQASKKSVSETETEPDQDEEAPKKAGHKKSKKKKALDHPPAIEMVLEAIESSPGRKGCSVYSIKAYILDNFKVNENTLKTMLKRALILLTSENRIGRPKDQIETKVGLMVGRYVLSKQKEKTEPARARPSKLRQLTVLTKNSKKGAKGSKKKKRKRSGFY